MNESWRMKKKMIRDLRELCKYFHNDDLKYCILRIPIDDDVSREFEVDVLVKDTDLKAYHNILVVQGFEASQDDVLSHYHYRRGRLHLDLVVSLCYGRKRERFISLGYDVLERRVFKDELYFADGVDELVMLVLRCIFDKRDFVKRSPRIFQLIDDVGEEKCFQRLSKMSL